MAGDDTTGNAASQSAGRETDSSPSFVFEWMVARRYISATRKGAGVSLISIIAFVGILLAVAVLIIVMSVMQGFRAKLLDQLLGVNGHVFVESGTTEPLNAYQQLADELRTIQGVTSSVPIIQSPVAMIAGEQQTAGVVFGINPADLRAIELIAGEEHLIEGSLDDFGVGRKGGNKIALGVGLARSLGVRAGDPITLVTAGGVETPMGTSPVRNKTYEVGAVYRIGNSEYDGYFVYMPLEQAQVFFKRGTSVDKIEVRVSDPTKATDFERSIAVAAGDGTFTYNWQDVHQSYFNALQTERGLMRIILSLIIAIAALNIISGLVMLVKDKRGDIAVMRTVGATQGAVMRIFCISGSLIGVAGSIIGVILGVLISLNISAIEKFLSNLRGSPIFAADIYLFDEMPAQVQLGEVAFVAIFALGVSFLAALYPAWRAAQLDPVEALRYE
ncbi:lipoprotein-releasing ABC transporter permease subunit [Parvularcula sp. IMCC14364]|uniref:lipoprotein-releasing ABC transporter permease subunit n=1 Tax=Parvularcula sp. IMCC14364 TaxID=3067902 RepID=UPI002741CAFC|nr:lipoprotein-releasing ABC transporter permease subunit [Parvularcula sp. IMCC14364]